MLMFSPIPATMFTHTSTDPSGRSGRFGTRSTYDTESARAGLVCTDRSSSRSNSCTSSPLPAAMIVSSYIPASAFRSAVVTPWMTTLPPRCSNSSSHVAILTRWSIDWAGPGHSPAQLSARSPRSTLSESP
jgi:hypothetical protein